MGKPPAAGAVLWTPAAPEQGLRGLGSKDSGGSAFPFCPWGGKPPCGTERFPGGPGGWSLASQDTLPPVLTLASLAFLLRSDLQVRVELHASALGGCRTSCTRTALP